VGLLNAFSVSNDIIERVRFAKTDYVSSANEGNTRSAIRLNGKFDRIAVLHNDLARCGDGCIDITTSPGAPLPSLARVSVEYNLVRDHDKTMLFGNFTCGDIGVPPCDAAYLREHINAAPVFFLTLNGNLFLRTSQRHPRVFGYAMADVVNNVMALAPLRRTDGSYSDLSGVFVADGARAWVEQNLFIPLWKSVVPWNRFQAVWTTSTPGAEKMPGDVEGFIRLVHNTVTESSLLAENQPGRVSFPADREALTVLPFDRMSPSRVVACVAARAGLRGGTTWNPALCKPH
jgi:pectate lyase